MTEHLSAQCCRQFWTGVEIVTSEEFLVVFLLGGAVLPSLMRTTVFAIELLSVAIRPIDRTIQKCIDRLYFHPRNGFQGLIGSASWSGFYFGLLMLAFAFAMPIDQASTVRILQLSLGSFAAMFSFVLVLNLVSWTIWTIKIRRTVRRIEQLDIDYDNYKLVVLSSPRTTQTT